MLVGPDGRELKENEVVWEEPKPKPNCKWCYGRGYIGIDTKTKEQVTCQCALKQIEKNARKLKAKINIKNPTPMKIPMNPNDPQLIGKAE